MPHRPAKSLCLTPRTSELSLQVVAEIKQLIKKGYDPPLFSKRRESDGVT